MKLAQSYRISEDGKEGRTLFIDEEPFPFFLAEMPRIDSNEYMSALGHHVLWLPILVDSPVPNLGEPGGDPIGA